MKKIKFEKTRDIKGLAEFSFGLFFNFRNAKVEIEMTFGENTHIQTLIEQSQRGFKQTQKNEDILVF